MAAPPMPAAPGLNVKPANPPVPSRPPVPPVTALPQESVLGSHGGGVQHLLHATGANPQAKIAMAIRPEYEGLRVAPPKHCCRRCMVIVVFV